MGAVRHESEWDLKIEAWVVGAEGSINVPVFFFVRLELD